MLNRRDNDSNGALHDDDEQVCVGFRTNATVLLPLLAAAVLDR